MFKRSRLTKAEVQSQCLQVERANTKSNAVYKKGSYNSTSLQGKTTMSYDFELGEDEMEPTSSVIFSTSLRITWSLGHASKTGELLYDYQAYTFIWFY